MSALIYKNIVKDVGFLGIYNILISLNGLILLPIITKGLGVESYGLYVQFLITITLVVTFATIGLPYATVRFLSGSKDKKQIQDDIWSTVVLIFIASIAVSLFLIAFSNVIAKNIFDGYTILVIIIALIVPFECANSNLLNVFRVFQEIGKYTVISFCRTYADLAAIILLIFTGYGIVEIAITLLILRVLVCILLLGYFIDYIGIVKPKFTRMMEYFKFGAPNIPANVASWISDASDRYIIGMFLGTTFVGYYNPGYTLGQIVSMFMAPIDFVLVSAVSKYYNENKIDLVRNIFKYALKYYLLIAVPAVFALSLLSKPILMIISTPDIAEKGYLVTPFVAFSMLLYGIMAISIGKSLFLAKKNNLNMIVWFLIAIINLALNIMLIPSMGIIAAAISTFIAFTIGFMVMLYFAVKYFDFEVDWIAIAKTIIASMLMSIVIIYLNPINIIGMIYTIVIGLLVYIIMIITLRTINKTEIDFFKTLAGIK